MFEVPKYLKLFSALVCIIAIVVIVWSLMIL